MKAVSFVVELRDKVSGMVNKVSVAFKELQTDVDKTQTKMQQFQSALGKLNMPNFNAILQVAERLGTQFAGATETGMGFGQSMADLSSITGIVGDELESLEANSRRFGKESGLGADAAARAYSLLASQIEISKIGIDGLNKLEEKSITLAHASGMSLDGAANALAGTINQFGLGADAADRVINVLAAGSKYGAAEIEELSQSFKVVGAAASAMGLDVESTAGALEILSQANLKGSEAGTALRNIILKMNTELGIDLGETSLGTALEALKPKLTDATYLSKVFGMENIAAAQFLIQNASAVDEMTAKLTGTTVAEEQAAIRTATTAQRMQELRASVDNIKIGLTDMLGSMAPYTALVMENAEAITLMGTMMKSAYSGMSTLNQMVVKLTGSTILQNVAAKAASVATSAWAAVQKALNFVLSANPIGLVVVAIGALVAGVIYAYNHFEGFRNICDKVWAAVKSVASAVWDFLVSAFEKASAVIKKAWEWVKKFFGIKDNTSAKEAASVLNEQTEAINANTAAKKENKAVVIDFNATGAGKGVEMPVANPTSYKELGDAISYYEKKLQETKPTETATIALLHKKIKAYKDAQTVIEQQWAASNRPEELNTLQSIDAEIEYQQSLRATATADNIAGIDAEIARLNALKTALEDSAHTGVSLDQITTYEQLNEELSYYEAKLQRATGTERAEIQKWINDLKRLRGEWDAALEAMNVPEDISSLDSISDLDRAISYYSNLQKNATASEIVNIQRTIQALEDKREALRNLTDIPSMEKEIGELDKLKGNGLQLKLDFIGLDTVKSRIRQLQSMLDDIENPLDEDQRKVVESLLGSWKKYEKVITSTYNKGDLITGSMENLSALMGNLSGVVGEGAAGWLSYGANILSAVAQAMPALASVIGGNIAQAFSGAAAQSQSVPFPYNLVALAASMTAVGAAVASIPKFANGGIAYGPTLGIFGEYAGASNNPEVVAPLDRLKSIIGVDGDSGGGDFEFIIDGRVLRAISRKTDRIKKRTR